MHVYIELWNMKQSWQELPLPERASLMDKVNGGMQALAEAGVECLGFGFAESSLLPAPYDFFAVWKAENRQAIDLFEKAISESGWFDYFEQINMTGALVSPAAVITQHILGRHHQNTPVPSKRARAFADSKKRTTVDGHAMAYTEIGQGKPIVFIHGEVTSSWLWRDIVPAVSDSGRCICVDLMGMGDSEKLDSPDPERYNFDAQIGFFEEFMANLGFSEEVILVGHDWGSSVAFEWARRHPDAVAGIAYMEPVAPPLSWDTWDPRIVPLFQQIKSPIGEKLILEHNLFVEALQVGVINPIPEEVMNEYRRPFLDKGESRRPTLTWPRSVPLDNEEHLWQPIQRYCDYLLESDVPKLALVPDPGGLLVGERLAWCRQLKNQTEAVIPGVHWLTEDSPDAIAGALSSWITTIRASE